MIAKKVINAASVWNNLNGVINVYKPSGIKVNHVRSTIIGNICRDINKLTTRACRHRVGIESTTNSYFNVKIEEDLSDHILVVGDRYQVEDVKCGTAAPLGVLSSGVLLLGINNGLKTTTQIHKNRPIRVFHVTGNFGIGTETNFLDSRIICKSSYRHINHDRLNGLLSSMQATHQKKMFELCGVDLQSQAAYELAISGTIRPDSFKIPVIYGIKCISFNRPEFILEIHSINETEHYLGQLVQEIGVQLKSVAHCTGIRCIRHGHFNINNSLLRRHWSIQGIISNIELVNRILMDNPNLLHQTNSELS